MNDLNEIKLFSKHLADISGKIIKQYFRSAISIDKKSDNSPVTIADKKAEEIMRVEISKNFPDHGIIGEEFGEENPASEFKWILDPIDGTKSFICGAVTFGTLIALTQNGKPLIGVINQPILNEFLIGDNNDSLLNGVNVKVRECNNLSDAVLLTTDHINISKYKNKDSFEELINNVKLYRNWGDCYGYYLLATGFADIMIEPIMSVWDSMALIPIINGAGGTITDYEGNDAEKGNSIVATASSIHSRVINMINST